MDARAGSLWHKRAGGAIPRSTPRHRGGPLCSGEAIATTAANADDADAYEAIENAITPGTGTGTVGEGVGYNGFYLAYWQNTC